MPFRSAEPTPAGIRIRVFPSVGSGLRVVALDADNHALLAMEVPFHLFDADRVRSAMARALAELGIEFEPRLRLVR